jgi:hypothetical protein
MGSGIGLVVLSSLFTELEVLARRHGVRDRTTPFYLIKGESPRSKVGNELMFSPGYDIAWFTSPTRSLGDAQVTAEYIAYNIKRLAAMSATKKVFIIGHSQGNINIQWALAFWPSVRKYVTGFSSLAGDFHGELSSLSLKSSTNIQEPLKDRYSVPGKTSCRAVANLAYSSKASDPSTSRRRTLLADLP